MADATATELLCGAPGSYRRPAIVPQTRPSSRKLIAAPGTACTSPLRHHTVNSRKVFGFTTGEPNQHKPLVMISEKFTTKTLQAGRRELAFFHGFPSTSKDWRRQLEHFADLGFGVIAPDLLGYGGSSKPDDVSAYNHRDMVDDVIKILDHEQIHRFHGISHDFGSHLMSRLYCYHPERLLSLTFISVPFMQPGVRFDLEAVNKRVKSLIGMEKFAYMDFFASSDSPPIVEAHLESFHSLVYEQDADLKAENFYPPGKLEAWLSSNRFGRQSIVDEEEKWRWLAEFRSGGFRGPTNWYRALLENIHLSQESSDLAAGRMSSHVQVPVLAIDSQPDKASVPGFMETALKASASQLSVKIVDAQGHWPHIIASSEVNKLIESHVSP